MEISRGIKDDIAILNLTGRLDLESSESLKAATNSILEDNHRKIVFDMSKVDFINSSGLGALISILKKVNLNQGRMVLTGLAPYVMDIFEMTQLSNIFIIREDVNQGASVF